MAEKMDVEETPQATAEKEEASDEVVPKDKAEAASPAAKVASRPKVEYVRMNLALNFAPWF